MTVDRIRKWAENAEFEYFQPQLEKLFGTPDALKAYRLILALCDVVGSLNLNAEGNLLPIDCYLACSKTDNRPCDRCLRAGHDWAKNIRIKCADLDFKVNEILEE